MSLELIEKIFFATWAVYGLFRIIDLLREWQASSQEEDDDDDIDGGNFDPDDPSDWWKTKSGRSRSGK